MTASDDEPRKRSGVAALYVDDDYIYYSCTEEVPQNILVIKHCLRKCDHKGNLICSTSFKHFIRGIGMDNKGYLYVAANSKVFRLNKDNMKPVRKTHHESSNHLQEAYQLIVVPKYEYVLVCSNKKRKICIFDYDLKLCFYLTLNFQPNGIAILHDRYFVVGKGTVATINIDFESKKYYTMEWKQMKVGGDFESFQEQANLRGICASNDYLLVTEVNENSSGRLLCLQVTDDQLECVAIKNKFSEHCIDGCTEGCSPVVVTHSNGADYYSQGYFNKNFHIVKVAQTNPTIETEVVFHV